MSTFVQLIKYQDELLRLMKLSHPRINVAPQTIVIDVWCDGSELESNKVIKITQKLRNASSNLVSHSKQGL